jgi:hypothetical protein
LWCRWYVRWKVTTLVRRARTTSGRARTPFAPFANQSQLLCNRRFAWLRQ